VGHASVHAYAAQEALRYTWLESEKAGMGLGDFTVRRWYREHWSGFLRARWLEHLQGRTFWIELDRGDFGLLQRQFLDQTVPVDRILDRLQAGQQNLDVLHWAVEWGIPADPVVEILAALDVNSRRLPSQFENFDIPQVTLDPVWLAWNDGAVVRLARSIGLEGNLDALPVLADCLEEAGCVAPEILAPCRAGGRDVRWSWVVDQILEQCWPLRAE
jgi:hypothetical protein